VLAAIYFQPAPTTGTSNLTISNFAFSETSEPQKCSLEAKNSIIFSGNLTKPTPCNGLTANYTLGKDSQYQIDAIIVNVTTTPYEGFCSQVLQNTFYTGSFEIPQLPEKGLAVQVNYGGKLICSVALVTNS